MSIGAPTSGETVNVPVPPDSMEEGQANGSTSSLSSPDADIRTVASGSSNLNSLADHGQSSKLKSSGKRPLGTDNIESKQDSKKAKIVQANTGVEPLEDAPLKHVYCHHCRQKRTEAQIATCSLISKGTQDMGRKKSGCGRSFCTGCLQRHYATDLTQVKSGNYTAQADETHDTSGAYMWACPHCRGTCKSTTDSKHNRKSDVKSAPPTPLEGAPNSQVKTKANGTSKAKKAVTEVKALDDPSAPHAFSNLFPLASSSVKPAESNTGVATDGKTSKPKKASPTEGPTANGSGPEPKKTAPRKSVGKGKAGEAAPTKAKSSSTKAKKSNKEPGSGASSLTPEPKPESEAVAAPTTGPEPHDPAKKQRPSHAFSLDFDSDSSLTPSVEGQPEKRASSAKKNGAQGTDERKPPALPKYGGPKPGSTKAKALAKSKAALAQTVKAEAKVNGQVKGKGKAVAGAKGDKGTPKERGKAKETATGEKKPRAKPVKKVEKPVEPPVFEKVDTRLGRVEAEQKIMLREYLHRFRPILSIPERSLPPLEDFDRPPTEASIKLFAGAMLDLIKEELEKGGEEENEEIIEVVTRFREELRYYGDLARFAIAYKTLEEPLGLRMPKAVLPETRGSANMRAVRALLDLEEHEEVPAWAEAGPSRRTGASRLPQPSEVIRMLLGLAERTLSSPALRTDLVWESPENEARRVHAREVKKENDQWEIKRKKMNGDAVRCKTAAATKAHKELVSRAKGVEVFEYSAEMQVTKETKEHELRLALANVNLRAALGTRTLRHGPLGTDLDGRVYYCLAHRPVDDDTRPPNGWASGLLVWGVGLPAKPDAPIEADELPPMIERWCHFGRSADVRQLVKWLEYRTRQAVEAAQAQAQIRKTPVKAKAAAGSTITPNGITKAANTPKTAGGSKQLTLDIKGTPSKAIQSVATPSKSGKKALFEVCIPVNKASRASTDDDLSSESELSELSVSEDGELLSHLLPEGYQPSIDTIREEGMELAKRVGEVAEWLEVLEWKGMGEVVK